MKENTGSPIQIENRRLAAIMFTDIAGFSRQMGRNEAHTLRLLAVHNQVIQQAVAVHHGTVIKTVGDAFLVDFPSVVHAVQSAQEIQAQFRTHNNGKETSEQIHVRIGIHLGDIVQKDGDVFGDGVNIASRLQELAAPDTICLSQKVYEEVEKKLALHTVVLLGRPPLKNIAHRFQVYALLSEKPAGFHQRFQVQQLKLKQWRGPLRVAALLVLLTSAGFIGRYFYIPAPAGLPLPEKPSIVVLPFVNMSQDPEQEYFSDGMTETLITDLSKLSALFVIARNSAFTYKRRAVDVKQVGQELGVRYVLEGSIQRAAERIRINTQLSDVLTGGHLWAERYDREVQDIFRLQDEIAQQVVFALKVTLSPEEQVRFRRYPTASLKAYDTFLGGLEEYYRFTKETNIQARRLFEQAIAVDPAYAAAYAFVGSTYWTEWIFQWEQSAQALEQAFTAAQKAAALDDSLAQAHMVLAVVSVLQKPHEQALAEAERAIALDPNFAEAYWVLGFVSNFAGRPREALEAVEAAMRLNPRYPPYYLFDMGKAYWLLGEHEKAVAAQKKALAINRDFLAAYLYLVAAYDAAGREEEARAQIGEILRISPNFSLEAFRQRLPYKDQAVSQRILTALRRAGLK